VTAPAGRGRLRLWQSVTIGSSHAPAAHHHGHRLVRRHHRQAHEWLGLEQAEYHYEYRYAYRPEVTIARGKMQVAGMNRAVRVRRLARLLC